MPDLDIKNTNNSRLPQSSQIKRSGFADFMTSLFGFRRARSGSNNIEFTQVDIGAEERVGQALIDTSTVLSKPLDAKLERLYQAWLNDNTDKYSELIKRVDRVNQLQFMTLNDPYVNRTVALYADEATQLDAQDTLINIETPDPTMTKDMYKLLNQWGVTQTRVRSTIEQLATYGDAFWANKISDKGVERIKPLKQLNVTDRLEFDPSKVLELKKRKEGGFASLASNNYLLGKMLDDMENMTDFSDMFETKLFGFELESDTVVPPWSITHFRVNADSSEFAPFGASPILGALAPFKQTQSAIALQSLARMMSFPTTIYKVKTSDQMDEGKQFAVVNKVRESYDNIGVSPTKGGSEVYTVNTKIWVPDGLLDVDVKDSKIDSDKVDDIELYDKRKAVSLGLPASFFTGEWYQGSGIKSGRALTQQYKPFGRKVYSLQSAFLEGLADSFRIHFAITGQYDFRVPFTLSMKYPVEETDDDKNTGRKNSIELAMKVVDIIKSMIGAGEEDRLPPDIIRDIVDKYTFLNPADIMKWTRDAKYDMSIGGSEEAVHPEEGDFGGDFGGSENFDLETSGESFMPEETPVEETVEAAVEESKKAVANRLREKELREKYSSEKDNIYFHVLQEQAMNNFVKDNSHVVVFNTIDSSNSLMLEALSSGSKQSKNRLTESEEPTVKKSKKKKKIAGEDLKFEEVK